MGLPRSGFDEICGQEGIYVMKIHYEIYDYLNEKINGQISELYWKVFHVEKKGGLGSFFQPNPAGNPIGVIAVTDRDEVVGHFATMCIPALIQGKAVNGRISMGFMVDPEYRGLQIASNLSNKLFTFLKGEDKTDFVIGFPNDNSFHMHIKRMGYKHVRDFQMVTLPKLGKGFVERFQLTTRIESARQRTGKNMIMHNEEFLNWRLKGERYLKFQSEDGKYFVCNKYKGCFQILYWSEQVNSEHCLEFANYIYNTFGVEEVRTWNCFDWLTIFPAQERKFHFCIHNLKKELEDLLYESWIFYPADCELF